MKNYISRAIFFFDQMERRVARLAHLKWELFEVRKIRKCKISAAAVDADWLAKRN